MKTALNVFLLVLIVGYIAYRMIWRAAVVYSSTSPDGKWHCVITDIDPSPYQVTLLYSMESLEIPLPLSGTQFVSYEDSALPGDTTFEWSQNQVIVHHPHKTRVADFGPGRQSWRE